MIRLVKRLLKSIVRMLIRRPYHFVKRNLKQVIVAYLLGMSPMAYINTALTTQYSLSQPQQIINVLKNAGIANFLTSGTLQPVKSLIQSKGGEALQSIGQMTNSTDLINQGENLALSASSWFDQGKETVNAASDKITEVSNQVTDLKTTATEKISDIKSSTQSVISSAQTAFDFYTHPDYYEILGLSNINESMFPEKGQIRYSELDEYGRTRTAMGTLTYENVKASLGKRGSFKTGGDNEPSGWIKMKKGDEVSIPWLYGRSYNGYFYNRSHLIADQLGGEAIRVNAITGTRPQNVGGPNQKGGMRYSEKKATDWLKKHKTDGFIYYSAEPVYEGSELVARYVIVKMKSSDGSIDEEVKVFNTANGWSINYQTGEYAKNE